MIAKVIRMVPEPVFRFLAAPFRLKAELMFQRKWVRKFNGNEAKVGEYWRTHRRLDEIKRTCSITPNMRVLDVGCGLSTVLHCLAGEKHGLDPLAEEYKRMYSYPKGITVHKGVGEAIPFNAGHFDVVFCSNGIDHFKEPKKALAEMFRVLKPGKHLVLTVEVFEKKQTRDFPHPHCFTKEDVISMLKENGFQIVSQKEAPLIGLEEFVEGKTTPHGKELIAISRKPAN